MTKQRRTWNGRALAGRLVVAATTLGALSVAGLSGTAAGGATNGPVVISTASIPKVGKVLVAKGEALYTLVPSGTACGAKCLKVWPAETLSAHLKSATAGPGVQRSKLGVTNGPGGTRQVTYNGRVLYRYVHDRPGQVRGNLTDEWGKWTAVVVARSNQHTPANPSGSNSNSNSNSGGNAGSGGVSF